VDNTPLPPPGRMTLPCRWDAGGLGAFRGRVRFRRKFGYPGQIDTYERVWLTFAGAEDVAEVWLNGEYLGRHEGAAEPFEFEVTRLLRARNELRVEVEASSGSGGLWGEVALEVRCTAYLQGVRVWGERAGEKTRLHVAGAVVGTCERPLDFYVLVDGATVHYSQREAEPAGKPFQIVIEDFPLAPARDSAGEAKRAHQVRVELVNGATVWYALEQEVAVPTKY
jgi:hypothetical protein